MDNDYYFYWVFGIIFGSYLVIKSIYKYSKLSKFIENGVETNGLIAFTKESYRWIDGGIDDGQTYEKVYCPVVEYMDEEGNELVCELKDEYSTSKNGFRVGSIIKLIYNKDKPHIAMKKSTTDLRWLILIPLAMGFFISSYCVFMLIDYFSHRIFF